MPIPVKSTADFFVRNSAPAAESDAIVVARPDGRFSVGYTDATAGPGVISRRYSADLSSTTTRTHANVLAVDEQQLGMAALRNNFEAFAWVEGTAGSRDIYAEVRSPTGGLIASRFLVNGAAGDQVRPEVIGLGDDRFAVVWIDDNASRIRYAIYDVGGNIVFAPVNVSTTPTSSSSFRQIDLAELSNGSFVIAYRPVISGIGSDATIVVINRDGFALTGEINVDGLSGLLGPPAVAALADDRFVVMNGDGTTARIFNNSGSASTAVFPVLSAGSFPQVTALADGRFMAVAVTGSGGVVARVMFADGTPDGAQFTVNTVATAVSITTVAPSIATLADGRVVVSWTTNESGNLDVKAAIYDPRESGLFASASGGDDTWVGTVFADTLFGGGGNDSLRGGDGVDALYGEDGTDSLRGDSGNDYLDGGNGADGLSGGAGNDTLVGGLGNDDMDGGTEDDMMFGGAGNDTMFGSFGNDSLDGGIGGDQMFGEGGNDTLSGGAGNDLIAGGSGTDLLLFDTAVARIVLDLGRTTAQDTGEGLDTISDIENVIATPFNDLISGGLTSGTGHVISAAGGDDIVFGLGANDIFDGGAGNDLLIGGGGFDVLLGGADADTLDGGANDDYVDGGTGSDTVAFESATARIVVNLGITSGQNTEQGIDTILNVENVTGTAFNDLISGDSLANVLTGGGGADILFGGDGNDTYRYVAQSDSGPAGRDLIAEFATGDRIDLSMIDANSLALNNQAFLFIGSAAFNGAAGQLRVTGSGTTWLVEADIDGNSVADFSIEVTTAAPGFVWAPTDFVL